MTTTKAERVAYLLRLLTGELAALNAVPFPVMRECPDPAPVPSLRPGDLLCADPLQPTDTGPGLYLSLHPSGDETLEFACAPPPMAMARVRVLVRTYGGGAA
jgi:hypothetical protein